MDNAEHVLLNKPTKYNIEDSNIALLGSDVGNSTVDSSLDRILMAINVQ